MPQVLVRNIGEPLLGRLKARARRHGRSLQVELKAILEAASESDLLEARLMADRIRRVLKGRRASDSGALQDEDRQR